MDDRVFVGLGSNLGDRLAALRRAVLALDVLTGTDVVRVSGVYETEPVGVRQQPDFLNAVVELRSAMTPRALLREAQRIENQMGRRRLLRWGPREIDIDLLFWGDRVIDRPELTLPHRELARRNFVLVPLAEIAAEFRSPLHGVSVAKLLAASADPSAVRKVASADALWPVKRTEVGVAP